MIGYRRVKSKLSLIIYCCLISLIASSCKIRQKTSLSEDDKAKCLELKQLQQEIEYATRVKTFYPNGFRLTNDNTCEQQAIEDYEICMEMNPTSNCVENQQQHLQRCNLSVNQEKINSDEGEESHSVRWVCVAYPDLKRKKWLSQMKPQASVTYPDVMIATISFVFSKNRTPNNAAITPCKIEVSGFAKHSDGVKMLADFPEIDQKIIRSRQLQESMNSCPGL